MIVIYIIVAIVLVTMAVMLRFMLTEDNFRNSPLHKKLSMYGVGIPISAGLIYGAYKNTDRFSNFVLLLAGGLFIGGIAFLVERLWKKSKYFYALAPFAAVGVYLLFRFISAQLMTTFLNDQSYITFGVIFLVNIYNRKEENRSFLVGVYVVCVVAIIAVNSWIGVDLKFETKPIRMARELLASEGYPIGNDDAYHISAKNFDEPFYFEYYLQDGRIMTERFVLFYDNESVVIDRLGFDDWN